MASEVTLGADVDDGGRRIRLLAALGLVVVAAAVAGWAGWSWASAANDDRIGYAASRDEVLATGKRQVAELTTMDYHHVDQGIARWLDNSTGALHEQLARTDPATKKSLTDGGAVATGKVLDAAVTELDGRTGTARLLASVEITIATSGKPPEIKRNRFQAKLSRTDHGWKLSALDQIPVGAA